MAKKSSFSSSSILVQTAFDSYTIAEGSFSLIQSYFWDMVGLNEKGELHSLPYGCRVVFSGVSHGLREVNCFTVKTEDEAHEARQLAALRFRSQLHTYAAGF